MPVYQLSDKHIFPPPEMAHQDGLLAVGGDLCLDRLLLAYQHGIFPWYSEGQPILWWSPDPRMLLIPEEFHISKSLARKLKSGVFTVTADKAFEEVIRACATVPRRGEYGTWLTEEMIRAYCNLHYEGYAHSIECWTDGVVVGGLYGVALGACFFGESMFSRKTDASKVAFSYLVAATIEWEYRLIDCQLSNPHLARLGAKEVSRKKFLALLHTALQRPRSQGHWTLPELDQRITALS